MVGMIPIVTPEEMRAIDAASPEPVDVLVARAGGAVARAALDLLGGSYGRRVLVIAGKGNNGADGREAARRLRRLGARVRVVPAGEPGPVAPCDLVVDAAYGTGFRGSWEPPEVGDTPVLAVDIPSGVDGLTGEAGHSTLAARRTVTFAALKPGLVLGRGRALAGTVAVSDIGLDASATARAHLVTDADVATWLPHRPLDAHKWQTALWVVAGSPGMTGAAALAARGAQRAGAGYVRLSTPGATVGEGAPQEVVATSLPAQGWADVVCSDARRFHSVVVGPGLGRDPVTAGEIRRLVARGGLPTVVDGDGLGALGERPEGLAPSTVLTPHDGEYARLTGSAPGPDRLSAARHLAAATGATVLLKGSTTVVARPGGEVLVSTTGSPRLATAGTGDVLAGVIAALLAGGLDPAVAAAAGAHLHGRAAGLGWPRGLVAGDVVDLLPPAFDQLRPPTRQEPHAPHHARP
jgi:hydroxyethylthiazole kinase-like uncharacterized protein yjeF